MLVSAVTPQQAEKPELVIQDGHAAAVTSIAFSPDGQMLVSGSSDNSVKLWDVRVGRLVRSLEGHRAGVNAVAFSPDNKTIASASDDKTIKLWDALTGRLLRTLEGHTDKVNSVAFSPNGRMLASGSADSWVNLWDANSGRLNRQLEGVSSNALAVAFSPDGSLLAAACQSQSVRLWEMRTGNQLSNNLPDPDHLPDGWSLCFSPNSKVVALGSALEDQISFLNCQTGQRATFGGYSQGILSVAFSPDGKVIASGGKDHSVRLFSTTSGSMSASFMQHTADVRAIAFSPDAKMLASASNDLTIKIWDVNSGNLLVSLGDKAFWVFSTTVSPDGRLIASSSGSGIKIWNAATGQLLKTLEGAQGLIMSVAFSPDGQFIAAANQKQSNDEHYGIRIWEVRSGKLIRTLIGHANWTSAIAFSPDGKSIFSAGAYRQLYVSDLNTGKMIERFPQLREDDNYTVLAVAISPDGRIVASGNDDKTIRLWNAASGEPLGVLQGHNERIYALAFSPDGRTLVSASRDRTLKLWDAQSGRLIRNFEGHTNTVLSVAFSPDGRSFASGSADQTIKLWEVATGNLLRTLQGHTQFVLSLAFNQNGRTLVSSSSDKTTRVWSVESGKLLASLLAFNDTNWIAYTPEGYYYGSDDASKYVSWRVGNKVYDFDQFFKPYFRPDILPQMLQVKAVSSTSDLAKGFAAPPEVVITASPVTQSADGPDIEITVEARDAGGGVRSITLYHNGKAIDAGERALLVRPEASKSVVRTYKVSLVDGANVFRAIAVSNDGTESRPAQLTINSATAAKAVSLHLLVIGINRYQNPGLNLNFSVPDATGVVNYFQQNGRRLFRDVTITQLIDAEATRLNILAAFQKLRQKAQPQDVVIVYFAGHGDLRADQWYFIPYELTHPETDEEVIAKGISSGMLSDEAVKIRAQKFLLLVDACKSGSLLTAFRGFEDRKALAQLARAAGIHVIAASTKDQIAAEVQELGHGVFTYLVLKGLSGDAVTQASGGAVTVRGLLAYLEAQLPELSRKYKTEQQFPVSSSKGMDFPLALIK
jgi:WD40 repeat protein